MLKKISLAFVICMLISVLPAYALTHLNQSPKNLVFLSWENNGWVRIMPDGSNVAFPTVPKGYYLVITAFGTDPGALAYVYLSVENPKTNTVTPLGSDLACGLDCPYVIAPGCSPQITDSPQYGNVVSPAYIWGYLDAN